MSRPKHIKLPKNTSTHSSLAPPFLDSNVLCFIRLTLEAFNFFNEQLKVIREDRAAIAVFILLHLSAWQKALYFVALVKENPSSEGMFCFPWPCWGLLPLPSLQQGPQQSHQQLSRFSIQK